MPGRFLYFAYGSNMLARRLRERAPSAAVSSTGYVERHRLTFDKVSADGSGKCSIEPTRDPDDQVYGVLFTIDWDDARDLDNAEGLGHGYRKDSVRVVTDAGVLTAFVYLAERRNPTLRPYNWYKAFVVQGAIENQLPAAYIQHLNNVESIPDQDQQRRANNEAVLHPD